MRIAETLPNPLFRSDRQAAILSILYLSPKKISIADLSAKLEIPYPTVHREIGRLLESQILIQERIGNTFLLSPNQQSPFYNPLRNLVEVSSGPVPLLRNSLRQISGIQMAALFGSWAHRLLGVDGPTPNDIDVMIVGNPDVFLVNKVCDEVGKRIGWEVNAVFMSPEEWNENTPFLTQVKEGGLIPILG